MLTPVTAIRFDQSLARGRTKPCLLACVRVDGTEVEVVAKFAAGCEMRHRSLVAEAVASMLAADLDLPTPEPFLVKIDAEFAATIPNAASRKHAYDSLGWNFGSKKLPPGFTTFPVDRPLPRSLLPVAAEVLAFDTFIANPDRTVANPNCLYKGQELAIFDHELAFLMGATIGWRPPWERGAICFPKGIPPQNRHLFLEQLRGKPTDLSRLTGAFEAIADERIAEYRSVLPQQWIGDGVAVDRILGYIWELRERIGDAVKELIGALL